MRIVILANGLLAIAVLSPATAIGLSIPVVLVEGWRLGNGQGSGLLGSKLKRRLMTGTRIHSLSRALARRGGTAGGRSSSEAS